MDTRGPGSVLTSGVGYGIAWRKSEAGVFVRMAGRHAGRTREAQSRRGECSLFHSRIPPGDDGNTLDMGRVLTRLGDGKRTPRKGSSPHQETRQVPPRKEVPAVTTLTEHSLTSTSNRTKNEMATPESVTTLDVYFFVAPKAPIT